MQLPVALRSDVDVYINTYTQFTCNVTFSMITGWSIKTCPGNCTLLYRLPSTVTAMSSELFIPMNLLASGIYELTFTVTIMARSNMSSSMSTYVSILPSNPIVNCIALGTPMISHGHRADLTLNPGLFSIDPEMASLMASVSFPLSNCTLMLFRLSRIGSMNTIAASMVFQISQLFKDQS